MDVELRPVEQGVVLPVLIQPRASRNEIAEVSGGRLKIRLTAPPVEGLANEALVVFLAKRLKVAKSRLRIIKGQKTRRKDVLIEGLGVGEAKRLLQTIT